MKIMCEEMRGIVRELRSLEISSGRKIHRSRHDLNVRDFSKMGESNSQSAQCSQVEIDGLAEHWQTRATISRLVVRRGARYANEVEKESNGRVERLRESSRESKRKVALSLSFRRRFWAEDFPAAAGETR